MISKPNISYILKIIFFIYRMKVGNTVKNLGIIKKYDKIEIDNYHRTIIDKITIPCALKVPFYAKYKYKGIYKGELSFDNWNRIPILEKNDLQKLKAKELGKKRWPILEQRKTSGFTGNPLKIFKDPIVTAYERASQWHFYSQYGINFFKDKQLRFWGITKEKLGSLKCQIYDGILNRRRISAFDINPNKIEKQIKYIEQIKPDYIYGYAQSIYIFACLAEERAKIFQRLNIKAIIVTGEMINDSQISQIKKVFKCPVVNEYGCSEVGIIAFQCPYGNMHLSEGNLFVEAIEKDNKIGKKEILITELYGQFLPIIRYSLGDLIVFSEKVCLCGSSFRVIEKIKGRKDEFIITFRNRYIDSAFFAYILNEIPNNYGKIICYKMIQVDYKHLEIYLFTDSSNKSRLEKRLIEKVKLYISEEMNITIKFMLYPELKKSGKLNSFKRLF